jgi:RNA polymerase sigma-70 factor (ECF subfamily)
MRPGTTDEELVLAYSRRGDRRALEALVERHFASAYRLALRLLGDPGSAEDAAEEAFLGLIRGAPRFEKGRSFDPWFRTLVLNSARKASRSRLRRDVHERAAARERGFEAAPLPSLEGAELAEHVARLPLDVRVPIVLHYYDGLSHERVAEVTGCPTGTASSRIRRGLEQLRESLAGAGHGAVTVTVIAGVLAAPLVSPRAPAPPSVARLEGLAAKAKTFALLAKAGVALAVVAVVGTAALAVRSPRQAATVASLGVANGSLSAEAGAEESRSASPSGALPVAERPTDAVDAPLPPTSAPRTPTAAGSAEAEGAPSREPLLDVVVEDAKGAPVPGALVRAVTIDAPTVPTRDAPVLLDDASLREEGLMGHLLPMPEKSARTGPSGHALVSPEGPGPGDRVMVYAGRGPERAIVGPVKLAGATRALPIVIRPLSEPQPGYGTVLVAVSREGAAVTLSPVNASWSWSPVRKETPGWEVIGRLFSDEAGVVAFRDVAPGRYSFRLSAQGTASAEVELDVADGRVEKVDLALPPEGALLGHVLAPAGAAVASASVSSAPAPVPGKRPRIQTARVASDGAYELHGLGAGKNELRASLEGFATRAVEVDVVPGVQAGPDIVLGVGPTLSGTLLLGSAPAARRRVEVRRSYEDVPDTVETDARGKWALRGVAPGSLRVTVDLEEGETAEASGFEVTVGDADVDLGELTITPAPADRIRGRVVDAEGSAVPGAEVEIVSGVFSPSSPDAGIGRPPRSARADAEGRFSITGLAEFATGEHGAEPGDSATGALIGLVGRARGLVSLETKARIGSPDEVVVKVDVKPGRVVGRVEAPASFLEAARLRLGGRERVKLGAGGTFEIDDVPPSELRLELESGHLTLLRPVVVKSGEEARADIELGPTGSIRPRLDNAPADARPSFSVHWGDDEGSWGMAEGDDLEALEVPAGPVTATLSIQRGGATVDLEKPVVARAGETTEVAFEWPARRP